MLCTFCGTDNRAENKFCGMCGVRMERRKVERRYQHNSFSPKCPSCKHVNEPGYKFCAMCGSRVDRRTEPRRGDSALTEQPRANAIANVQLPTPDLPAAVAEEVLVPETAEVMEDSSDATVSEPLHRNGSRYSGAISGPSFLGLNDEPGETGDYLLEEEERSPGGVLRRLMLLAALAALGGLAFVQWRAGFPLLHTGQQWLVKATGELEKRATPAASTGGAGETKASVDANPANTSSPTETRVTRDKVPDLAPPEKVRKAPDIAPVKPVDTSSKPVDRSLTTVDTPAGKKALPATKTSLRDLPTTRTSRRERAKSSKNQSESPSPLLLRAQEYIHGTGGRPQNCDQGMVYLRAAAKTEAAAAVQMGTLYATGHCVPQDRIQAYRWFNSARELQPANPQIQSSMNQLWAHMTLQERRQIIR